MSNEELYEQVIKAIDELFSDTSVSTREAINNLQALKDEIDIRIETLEVNLSE
jgi:hypothetical protein